MNGLPAKPPHGICFDKIWARRPTCHAARCRFSGRYRGGDAGAGVTDEGDCENPILITAEVPTTGAITADDGRYALSARDIASTCTPASNRADVYEWRVTENGTYDLQVESDFEAMLAYGDTCESGNTIACSDAVTVVEQINGIQAEAGQTYYVIVAGFDDTEVGTYTLTIKQPSYVGYFCLSRHILVSPVSIVLNPSKVNDSAIKSIR